MGWDNLPRGERGDGLPSKRMAKRDSSAIFWTLVYFWINSVRDPDFEVKRISIPAVVYSGYSKILLGNSIASSISSVVYSGD
jgi:hypothetical protein